MKEQTRYIERGDLKGATHLEIKVSYSKGGRNYITGEVNPRGFYVSVTPVTKKDGMIRFVAFTGQKRLLLEVSRFTEKQFGRAVAMAKNFEDELIDAVVSQNKAA